MTTAAANILLDELIKSAEELIKQGEHEGSCTNANQMRLLPKIASCKLHDAAMKSREEKFRRAVDQLKLLRDVFDSGPQY